MLKECNYRNFKGHKEEPVLKEKEHDHSDSFSGEESQ